MGTWDVRTDDGKIVSDLTGLASALVTGREEAARTLLADETLIADAPAGLLAEAKQAADPSSGGDTPPSISTGSFVSWSGGKGRVDLVVKKGKVPGVSGDVEATSDSPAARVVVWKDGKATGEKIAVSTHKLKRIEPLNGPGKKDAVAALVDTVAQHQRAIEERGLPEHARVSGAQVKSVYDRGLGSWPGYDATTLDREEWALGRVGHFVKVATGDVEAEDAGHDVDLLDQTHPLAPGYQPPVEDESVTVSISDLATQVKSLRTPLD